MDDKCDVSIIFARVIGRLRQVIGKEWGCAYTNIEMYFVAV